jgi:MFS family permease
MERNVKLLSLGFALIFFGFNGTQQYITAHFESLGQFNLGFNILLIVYFSFMVASPFSPIFVFRYRAKSCVIVTALAFSLFIISLLSMVEPFIYLTAVLLGIGAAVMWTAQNTYIIRISSKDVYGANSGFFTTLFNLGTGLGIIVFGYLMVQYSFNLSIIVFSIAPLLGIAMILWMKEPSFPVREKREPMKMMKQAALSGTVMRLSSIWFSFTFVMGLAIGILPIQINHLIGVEYIGILSSLFFLLPIATSYAFGRLSDIKGRTRLIHYSYVLGFIGLAILYLATEALGLILGIILLALNYSLLRPITMALPGDLTKGDNLVILTALFWTMRIVGVFSALLISLILPAKITYLVSLGVLLASFLLVLPALRFSFSKLKQKIELEIREKTIRNP